MTKQAYITGLGSYLPERVLKNAEFEKMVETTDEWITTRTGIKERRIAALSEQTSDMGVESAKRAIVDASIDPSQIDLILVATTTPDYLGTNTGGIIQEKLGLKEIPCFDIQAACSGFLYALSVASAFIKSGTYNNILLIASEKMSAYTDYQDRSTCILFGDGASAAIVSNERKGLHINEVIIGCDGKKSELIYIPSGGTKSPTTKETLENREHYFKMAGREVFKHAVRRMNGAAEDCLKKANISQSDIAWLIPHQANLRILNATAKKFDIPDDRVYKTVHKYGNTSASGISIALDELLRNKPVKPNDHFLLVTFGAGLTWGASILTKVET